MAAAGALHEPLLEGAVADAPLTERLLTPLEIRSRAWAVGFVVTGLLTVLFGTLAMYTFATGIGVWGNDIPVAWAFGIVNFVWWIGIGHAGTFISAFLLLLEQPWRASVNRIAEAMTLFAVAMAACFPLLHLGRAWFAYWLVPYPATMGVWPQFRSALPWDFAAISTYGTVSLVFWYTGLIPDLATVRDRAASPWRRRAYGVFALGWRGSQNDWKRHRVAYGLLAGLATPLVVSVHSIVSLDFAITQLPGWHATIFPPYFVIGALLSGFAMVATLLVPVRALFGLESVITRRHLDAVAKLLLAMAWLIVFCYAAEFFCAWYGGAVFERSLHFGSQPFGRFAFFFWLMLFCNGLLPQVLWVPRWRRSPWLLFAVSLGVQLGMWTERFVIIVSSLAHDFLPSSWRGYAPTWVDLGLLTGSIGTFGFLFLLFLRFVPPVAIAELKALREERGGEAS